jgi:hypothetical protein
VICSKHLVKGMSSSASKADNTRVPLFIGFCTSVAQTPSRMTNALSIFVYAKGNYKNQEIQSPAFLACTNPRSQHTVAAAIRDRSSSSQLTLHTIAS